MVGVRREGVTVAAHRLQEAGMIIYMRGHINIIDRHELLSNLCECYHVVKMEHERLLGQGVLS